MTDDYQKRKALSASMAWAMVSECPAQAWHSSPWNPDYVEENAAHFDIGKAVHLAVLEPETLADRVWILDYADWRSKEARAARDQAYIEGKIPLLMEKDYTLVLQMRRQLENSDAVDLLFGEGMNEYAYYWEWDGVPCKAKADRIIPRGIVDLKTAPYASPEVFQRAVLRDGHHLRAVWYIDGYAAGWATSQIDHRPDYLFVVVAKEEPHLVSIFRLDEGAIERGRTLYRRALHLFRQCQETGIWPTYTGAAGEKITTINLPTWYDRKLEEESL